MDARAGLWDVLAPSLDGVAYPAALAGAVPPELGRRHANHAFEMSREMTLVEEADLGGNLGDG